MKPSIDLRRIPAALESVGAEHVSTKRTKHYKVTFAYGGLRRFVVVSCTSGNDRAKANVVAEFRRELRALGIRKRFQI
jgi:hypothetical protein